MAMSDIVSRINRIVEGLMGCSLEFQPASSLDSDAWDSRDLEQLAGDRAQLPVYVKSVQKGVYGFPMIVHGAFAGLAVVRGWNEARPRKLLLLAELLSTSMEYGLRQEERRERLRLIEERLQLVDETSNVIPLRPARYGRVLQVTDQQLDSESVTPAQPSPLTSTPILIETQPGFPLQRVAVEIHHLSKRWAFLNVEDLPSDVFDSRESFEQLGAVTIFIRDLTNLPVAQQLKLAEYLATKPGSDHPQIIAGIDAPVSQLSGAKVLAHLLDLFCVTTLEMTDKSPEQITSDLINASLRHIVAQTNEVRESHQIGEHFIPFHTQYFDPDQPTMH